jgi:phage terminase large subunit-like protein
MHAVTQYAVEAVAKKRVVGETERMACLRHLNDLARAGQLPTLPKAIRSRITARHEPGFQWRFDEARADRVFRFFGHLNHVEGMFAGTPIYLIDAHKFDQGSIFGWLHKETGMRRFRKAYIQEARKNAKTTRLAGVANYMMVGDGEQSPKVYTAAVDREQARLLYDASKAMAESSKDLSKRLDIRDYKITHRTRGGKMAPLSKETKNKDGLNPSCAIIDEYHAHPTSEIYDVISSAKGQRAQSLLVIITTAGMDTESPCYKEYQYCKDILSGKISGDQASQRYFVMIRELDPNDDEHDPKNWIKANPLRCLIPESLVELREQHDEAFSSQDPAKVRTFRVKNLNRWVHGNEDTYMGEYMEKWDQLAIPRDEFWELVAGLPCNVGADLSKKIDLTADGFVFALPDGRIAVSATGFMPEEGVKKHEKTDHIPYKDWAKDGWLIMTEGNVTDYDKVLEHIQEREKGPEPKESAEADENEQESARNCPVQELCADPWNATQFLNDAQKLGYTTVEIRQTMANLSEATKLFRELVSEKKLVHDGSPLLKWCVGNAVQIVDSKENIMLSKKNAGDVRRIDLLAALINALVRIQPLKEAVNYSDYLNSDEFGF